MDEIKGRLTDKSQEILTKWEEKSRDFIGSFIDMFGRDGRLVSMMKSFSTTNIFQDENNNESNNGAGKK